MTAPPARDGDAVIVFVKAPRPGTVKTRLAAGLGPDGEQRAADLYRGLAESAVATARALAREGAAVTVHFAPGDAAGEVAAWLGPDIPLVPQAAGDLGARMASSFSAVFAAGASRAVLVGSDCPGLDPRRLREALAALRSSDLVLGPAADGGYWLIGARGGVPPVLDGIPWSTVDVLRRTLDLATARARLRVVLLDTLHDVDTASDVSSST